VSAAEPARALVASGISKRFGAVRALDGVSLMIRRGEVHGLVGRNGSGKSTLIRILAAYHAPEPGGALEISGRAVALPLRPGDPQRLGLSFVHQQLGLIPSLSVRENLYLGELARDRRRWISRRQERARAREALARFGLSLDPERPVRSLRPVERALLAVVRAVEGLGERGVLFLDEPTAFLPKVEARRLFELVARVAEAGSSVVLVSHDLDEVLEHAGRATVLREGRDVAVVATSAVDRRSLGELVTGGPEERPASRTRPRWPAAVRIEGLAGRRVRGLSLELGAGEVVGLTGLLGSGFDEVPYLLFGARPARAGTLALGGAPLALQGFDPARAVAAGLALVPGDRDREGGVPSLSVGENVSLPVLPRYQTRLRLDLLRLRADVARLLVRFGVEPPEPRRPFGTLSGGNQQKALLARALNALPRLLLLDEPTRGVDIAARDQLVSQILDAAEAGAAVLWASEDQEQLAGACDRVLVFSDGRLA
jgi:ribose transport system ATP-binding protein